MLSNFGREIEILQAENDVSLNELAKRTGKSKQCINGLKKSKRPRPVTVRKFAYALNVPIDRLYAVVHSI